VIRQGHPPGRVVLPAGLLALAWLVAVPAVAQAPIEIEVDAVVKPNKAGTKRNPQGVRLTVHARLVSPLGEERPIMTGGTVLFPRGAVWNGAKYPKCSQSTLERRGLQGCPKRSVFGRGHAKAFADTVVTRPRITIVNGGARRVYFYTVMNNPARVAAPVVGRLKRRKAPWAIQLDYAVPRALQVVAGVPITVTEVHLTAGRGDIMATDYCPPSRRWRYEATVFLDDGRRPSIKGSEPCRR
jgi:hypothetical protein